MDVDKLKLKRRLKISLIAIAVIAMCTALFYYEVRSRTFQFFGELVSRTNPREKVIALTFDDGPSVYTKEIIQTLEQHNIKATFFLIGREIEQNMEETKMLIEAGEEIGNHSYSHERLILKSYSSIKSEIEKTDSLIRAAGYKNEILFRPPGCKKFIFLPYYLMQHNRKTITWDVEPETYDEGTISAEKIFDYVINHTSPGSIILLHVMTQSRTESRKALPEIIVKLQEKGYKFVTVSELLKY